MERPNWERMAEDLRRQRDELKVRLHLAGAEVREEWDELEKKWEKIRARLAGAGKEAQEAAGDVGTAMGLVVDELKKGYERIRRKL